LNIGTWINAVNGQLQYRDKGVFHRLLLMELW